MGIHMYSMINETELSPVINTYAYGKLSPWEGFHENWMGKRQVFSTNVAGTWGCLHVKNEVDLYHLPFITKVNSKWMRERWKVKVLVTLSCLTFCHLMDGSPPGSFVLGIFQARVLEWVYSLFQRTEDVYSFLC